MLPSSRFAYFRNNNVPALIIMSFLIKFPIRYNLSVPRRIFSSPAHDMNTFASKLTLCNVFISFSTSFRLLLLRAHHKVPPHYPPYNYFLV